VISKSTTPIVFTLHDTADLMHCSPAVALRRIRELQSHWPSVLPALLRRNPNNESSGWVVNMNRLVVLLTFEKWGLP
jgi:hypothetical protein